MKPINQDESFITQLQKEQIKQNDRGNLGPGSPTYGLPYGARILHEVEEDAEDVEKKQSELARAIKNNSLADILTFITPEKKIAQRDKDKLKKFLMDNKNLDDPDLLTCLEKYNSLFIDDEIKTKIASINSYYKEVWSITRPIILESTPLPTVLLDNIIQQFDSPLNRLSLFSNETKKARPQPALNNSIEDINELESKHCCIIL